MTLFCNIIHHKAAQNAQLMAINRQAFTNSQWRHEDKLVTDAWWQTCTVMLRTPAGCRPSSAARDPNMRNPPEEPMLGFLRLDGANHRAPRWPRDKRGITNGRALWARNGIVSKHEALHSSSYVRTQNKQVSCLSLSLPHSNRNEGEAKLAWLQDVIIRKSVLHQETEELANASLSIKWMW